MQKYVLGKVFISHSSKDKPFVRRLTQRLWREGYQVWLDEKELVPGDALANRLSDALKEARVVIVVVTPASRRSKWLAFELNKATERMVKGECRIIPVLAGRVALPSELEGIVYSDFRRSPKKGMTSLMAALDNEVSLAVRGSWRELDSLIEDAFDSSGWSSRVGGYESLDYSFVTLKRLARRSGNDVFGDGEIVYDTIHDYGGRGKPLDDDWWNEYRNVHDRYGEIFHLVVSERPMDIPCLQNSKNLNRISYVVENANSRFPFCATFADLNGIHHVQAKRSIIENARQQIIDSAKEVGMWLDVASEPVETRSRRRRRRA